MPAAAIDHAMLSLHYTRFRVGERILLTGHSHQAWPDCAFEAQQQAWLDAAALVDDKWERAAAIADRVRNGWRRLLGDRDGEIALGPNTHELIVRWLSAILPVFGAPSRGGSLPRHGTARPVLITSNGEFHTIRRQLDRLSEEGVDVVKVDARPVATLAERLARSITDGTHGVLVSSVLFETAEIVDGLDLIAGACARHDVPLLVDAYHHLNVVPFDIDRLGLQRAFVVGGGYKYCQLGEGNCFLRLPPACDLRPVFTGWFSEFAALADERRAGEVPYGQGAARFAGATYDPTSHYRADRVFAFHEEMGLTPEALRAISQRQVGLLVDRFTALDIDPRVAGLIDVTPSRRAGFVAIRSHEAAALAADLRRRGVYVDSRGDILRLGPAPYVSDEQLDMAVAMLGDCLRQRA
jgi:kynureninase